MTEPKPEPCGPVCPLLLAVLDGKAAIAEYEAHRAERGRQWMALMRESALELRKEFLK